MILGVGLKVISHFSKESSWWIRWSELGFLGSWLVFFLSLIFFPFFFVGCLRPLFYENASWDRSDWRKQSKHYWKWLFFLQLEATYFKDCASLQKVHLLCTVVEIVPYL
jgi:hypothetical protein